MAIHENLAVPYHQQDTDVYCGAACAQMVLDSIGTGLLNQDDLYTDARNNTSELSAWYTPPDGLRWVMNDRRPAGFGGYFVLYALSTEDAISRKLVWTINHYQVAPIALVFGGDHWIVVRGYEASAAPTGSGDTSYTITAFETNNPWPPVPSFYLPPPPPPHPAPPPHSGTDNCGTGGNRGTTNEHIAYATWQSTYMTGNAYGSLWNGKNVAVCDPDPPAKLPGQTRPPAKRLRGDKLLTPKTAVRYAMAGLDMYKLPQRKGWRKAFRDTAPGHPVLVQRLDKMDSYYYIVPLERRRGTVTAAVAVDARFGDYRQTIALPEGGSSILTALDRKVVLEMTVGRRLKLEGPLGHMIVRKEAFCLYPALVWQPCLESLSPFWPFHMITVGDQRIYVRIDGQIFTQLHTHIPGV